MIYLIENSVFNGRGSVLFVRYLESFDFRASDANLGMIKQKSPYRTLLNVENACLLMSHRHREFQRPRAREIPARYLTSVSASLARSLE